ncbi:MAG: class I SAM-dependent methyltransferase [Candidatus Methanofastidiosia archaeon]|jgi:SAM-dependent methyltransferase
MLVKKEEDYILACEKYYQLLAQFMVDITGTDFSIILEIGCGGGNLTGPLYDLLDSSVYIGVDLYSGVYVGSLSDMKKRKVHIMRGDVTQLGMSTESIECVFGNELLCELTREDTLSSIKEVFRVLKKGGMFVHGVLSPYPANKAQEMVILADSYSEDPLYTKEWFSPPADELAGMFYETGFFNIGILYFTETITFLGESAVNHVKSWHTNPEFFEKYEKDLLKYGLEYPMTQVIYGRK